MRTFAPLRPARPRLLAGQVVLATWFFAATALAQGEPPEGAVSGVAPSPPPGGAPTPGLPPSLPPPPVYLDPAAPFAVPPPPAPVSPPAVAVSPPPVPVSPPPAPIRHVPRAGGITVGWTYTPSNNLPLSSATNVYTPSGIDLDARFGWQIGGIDAGWPSWVGFMAGFFYYVGDQGINDSLGIDYGIFLKHALFPGQRIRLFIGYGLGVAQVWVKDVGGHGIGHETRLSVGLETKLAAKVHFTVEFAYKLIMLPAFTIGTAEAANYNFQAVNLMAGLWFGR